MTDPIPGTFNRPPISGYAVQFDGTITSLLDVFNRLTGDTDGVYMNISFGPNSTIRQVTFGGTRINFSMNNRDWVILPGDGSPLFVVTNEVYLASWQSDAPAPAAEPKRGAKKD